MMQMMLILVYTPSLSIRWSFVDRHINLLKIRKLNQYFAFELLVSQYFEDKIGNLPFC